MKVMIINPGSDKYSEAQIERIEKRIIKSMKQNKVILFNDDKFTYRFVDIDDVIFEKGE